MKYLIKKELGHFFNNPFGFIILIVFGVFANFLFVKDLFLIGTVSMRQFFAIIPWITMIFIPALAMRSLAEEKRLNTIEILRTLPITETQIVIAKFVSLLIVSAVGLLLTVGLPISLYVLGSSVGSTLYLPEIFIGYIGLLAYFAMGLALSIFYSGMTSNQVVALLLSAVTLFVLNLVGTDFVGTVLPKIAQDVLVNLSPINHLDVFVKGVLDVRSIFYFVSTTTIFLFLTIVDLEKRT